MPKKPDPECKKCGGKGLIEWSSTMGGKPYARGVDSCECTKTDDEKRADRDYDRAHEHIC